MNNYLKHSKHDKLLGNILIFIYSIIAILAIFFFGLGIKDKVYIFSVIVVVIVLIVGTIFTKIEKIISKRMSTRDPYYVIPLKNSISYNELVNKIDGLKNKNIRFDYSDYANVFSFSGRFKYKLLLTHQETFSLDKYKDMKKKVNHLYNRKFKISQKISPRDAASSFTVNIICCDGANNELYSHMSNDAEHCLHRVVGLMEVAIVGNMLIIPSIRTLCEPPAINHYVRFNKLLFELLDAIRE